MNEKRNVVVTGFGPFAEHSVNASWESVKELKETSSSKFHQDYNVELIIEELPVAWGHVNKRIPELWKEHDPLLMIHVGVSKYAHCLTIESRSCSSFQGFDIYQNHPPPQKLNENCKTICTEFDLQKLCDVINNKNNEKCKACISIDPGHYLCAYTYYQSLSMYPNKTLFIHVPDLNIYPSSITAHGLFLIIENLLKNTVKQITS